MACKYHWAQAAHYFLLSFAPHRGFSWGNLMSKYVKFQSFIVILSKVSLPNPAKNVCLLPQIHCLLGYDLWQSEPLCGFWNGLDPCQSSNPHRCRCFASHDSGAEDKIPRTVHSPTLCTRKPLAKIAIQRHTEIHWNTVKYCINKTTHLAGLAADFPHQNIK